MEDPGFAVQVLLPAGLAVIMFSLGLTLVVDDFRRVFSNPRGVAIGLLNLVLISPFLAFLMATVFNLDPVLAVGLVVLGASPGGVLANLLTHLARGEVALSVSMTAISSVASVIVVPLYLGLAIAHFDATSLTDDVSMPGIVARVFSITIIPLAIGMRIRAQQPERAGRLEPQLKRAAMVAFVGIVATAVISEWEQMASSFDDVAPAALALNIAAMGISFATAQLVRLDTRQATAIAMELGLHNSTLAIAVATAVSTEIAIPAAVYSAFMFVTAGAFARIMFTRNSANAPGSVEVQHV